MVRAFGLAGGYQVQLTIIGPRASLSPRAELSGTIMTKNAIGEGNKKEV